MRTTIIIDGQKRFNDRPELFGRQPVNRFLLYFETHFGMGIILGFYGRLRKETHFFRMSGWAGNNPASCREKNTPTPEYI
jgi:hypothetical protein